jgi:hypothetical protein
MVHEYGVLLKGFSTIFNRLFSMNHSSGVSIVLVDLLPFPIQGSDRGFYGVRFLPWVWCSHGGLSNIFDARFRSSLRVENFFGHE